MMNINKDELISPELLSQIAHHFNLRGIPKSFKKIGSGHIHRTFLIQSEDDAILLQQVNHSVFKDLEAIQRNLQVIQDHFNRYEVELKQLGMTFLRLRNSTNNELLKIEEKYWRAFEWIDKSESFDNAPSSEYAFQAAIGFGRFLKVLSDLPLSSIRTTIPAFHSGTRRWKEFERSLQISNQSRLKVANELIQFAQKRKSILISLSAKIDSGFIPIRLTHNDTKVNNILFHSNLARVKCVIDLDTVMEGSLLFDFGDMIRTIASTTDEDCITLEDVGFNKDNFIAVCNGFASEVQNIITQNEKEELLNGAKYMCLIIGLRFLTDFLNGDVYYPVQYENHNLIRARNQFKLVNSLEENENTWKQIIRSAFGS